MIVKELVILINGSFRLRILVSDTFKMPALPKRAINPIATTIVGITKGTVVKACRKDLPANSYLENIYAMGNPANKAKIIERNACQIVNHILPK